MNTQNISQKTLHFLHPNTRSFVRGYSRQDANLYESDSHYFRGGSRELTRLENDISQLVGFSGGNVILTTSGMSAFLTAIDCAEISSEDIVVHGEIEYGQIYNYINSDLRAKGIIPVEVPAGDTKKIEKVLKDLHQKKQEK